MSAKALRISRLFCLVFLVSIIFPVSACDAQEQENENEAPLNGLGYYQVSSECEKTITDWSKNDPIPDCAFSRLKEIFDHSDLELKRQYFDVLCAAEYTYARKQPNHRATEFFGSVACKHSRASRPGPSGSLPQEDNQDHSK